MRKINKMSRELKYYHNNKHIINSKRKLRYELKTNKISKIQFDIAINSLNNTLNIKNVDEELLTDIFTNLDDCYYNELCLIEIQINKLKKKVLKK